MTKNFARKEYIKLFFEEFAEKKQISNNHWEAITDAIIDDVVKHVNENADPDDWDEEDVRRAIGSVICERLGI